MDSVREEERNVGIKKKGREGSRKETEVKGRERGGEARKRRMEENVLEDDLRKEGQKERKKTPQKNKIQICIFFVILCVRFGHCGL